MSRPMGGFGLGDPPKYCNGCGRWPAPIRPDHRLAYCERCAKEVERGPEQESRRS